MLRKFTVLFLLAAASVISLPAQGKASTFGDRNVSISGFPTENLVLQQRRGRGRGGRNWDDGRGRRRSGSWYGYRNYGQYRRTQVGNRRYRTERRSVWRDGRRVSIWRRIFY
jgi:hypothetical protein